MGVLDVEGKVTRGDSVDFNDAVLGSNFVRTLELNNNVASSNCGTVIVGGPLAFPPGTVASATGEVLGTENPFPVSARFLQLGSTTAPVAPAVVEIKIRGEDFAACFIEGAQQGITYQVLRNDFSGGELEVFSGRITVRDSSFGAGT